MKLDGFKKGFVLLLFMVLVNPWASKAYAVASQTIESAHTQVRLIGDHIQVGKPFWIALQMKMDPNWHTYWSNPGDSGLPTSIKWTLPKGYTAGPIQWPYPHRMDEAGLTTFGYEGTVFLVTKFEPPEDLRVGETVTIQADVRWLACEKVCIPGEADLSIELPIRENRNRHWEPYSFVMETVGVPTQSSIWKVSAKDNGQHVILYFKTPKGTPLNYIPPSGPIPYSLKHVEFFPYQNDVIDHTADQLLVKDGDNYKLILKKSTLTSGPLKKISGVLVNKSGWGDEKKSPALEIVLPVTYDETARIGSQKNLAVAGVVPGLALKPMESFNPQMGRSMTVWLAIVFAFLGGIILNLMPCVLPVLSIKILTLLEHKDDKAQAWQSGLVFSLGVLVSFWVLAGLLILLKAAGQQIGWGFQFQSPAFIVFLSMLLFLMFLNLFGVFEVGASLLAIESKVKSQKGFQGSFTSGVLATIVATPCTAPFMGTAIGFALSQPAYVALIIFTALGLGMASPYLLLSRFPQLLHFLPKPGAWMVVLKKFLGLLLFLTVVWLMWVLGLQRGGGAVLSLLIGLGLGTGAAVVYGQWTPPSNSASRRRFAYIVSGVLLVAGWTVALIGAQRASRSVTTNVKQQSSKEINWQDYSPELVDQLRKERRPIFIDFTAAWCLSCQVNERVTFHDPKVIKKFRDIGIVPIKADWTTRDETITKALEKFGKNSIPLYVIYTRDPRAQPILLPEIITPQIVIDALEKVKN